MSNVCYRDVAGWGKGCSCAKCKPTPTPDRDELVERIVDELVAEGRSPHRNMYNTEQNEALDSEARAFYRKVINRYRTARIQADAATIAGMREELDERDEWSGIVDSCPLDGFDALGDHWLSRQPVDRMFNAATSVFSKWANDELMGRFKDGIRALVHQAFVEGCIVGVKNERSRAALKGGDHG